MMEQHGISLALWGIINQAKESFAPRGIIEKVIIAVVTGAVAIYSTQQMMKVEITFLKESQARIERKVDKIMDDIYKPYGSPHETNK